MEPQAFYAELNALQDYFEAMAPELEVTVRDPALGVEGYVVVWNTGISVGGPLERCGKGGTRITPQVSLNEVKMLARTMALKNAAAGLPLGGAKSGLRLDPSAPGFEKQYRRFVRLCAPLLHENGGPFGGFGFDIGARPEHALWACDELKSNRCFTGKPLNMGGTDYDREGIAGLGVAVAGSTMMEVKGASPATASFAVQGMGAMGAAVLRYFSETGAHLAALGDPKYEGTWTFEKPLSADLHRALVRQDIDKAKSLLPKEGKRISSDAEDVLYLEPTSSFPAPCRTSSPQTMSIASARVCLRRRERPRHRSGAHELARPRHCPRARFHRQPGRRYCGFCRTDLCRDQQGGGSQDPDAREDHCQCASVVRDRRALCSRSAARGHVHGVGEDQRRNGRR